MSILPMVPLSGYYKTLYREKAFSNSLNFIQTLKSFYYTYSIGHGADKHHTFIGDVMWLNDNNLYY